MNQLSIGLVFQINIHFQYQVSNMGKKKIASNQCGKANQNIREKLKYYSVKFLNSVFDKLLKMKKKTCVELIIWEKMGLKDRLHQPGASNLSVKSLYNSLVNSPSGVGTSTPSPESF